LGKPLIEADDCCPAKPAERPRIKIAPLPGPLLPKVTLGVYLTNSLNVATFSLLSVLPEKA